MGLSGGMTVTIAIESPLTDDAADLIVGSEAALRAVYTEDECFTFTADELARPGISFFVARTDGVPLGCVALCAYDDYAEIKRLYVDPKGRGQGVARALIAHLEQVARQSGLSAVKLETGDKLSAAVKLYSDLGYHHCGPFGEYKEHPASLFMTKNI
ncbi:GNAT family N-acetyltransferase [Pseudaestuariivita rosea]|uniref:GNAT family N-acetyltransferase n=1 Tax=Pseudaestuariivita rosea TaxID=2763263 RepID=UPI001ABA4D78|nr:GNAT family N-acetyltransferase [Pseudaestuariivita rosea]